LAVPILLSQGEIEEVGRYEESRQRLLDGFVPSLRETKAAEDAARALIASLTVELRRVLAELANANDDLQRSASVGQDLTEARAAAVEASAGLEKTVAEQARLAELDKLTAQSGVRLTVLTRAVDALTSNLGNVSPGPSGSTLDPWPSAAGSHDLLAEVRAELLNADRFRRAAQESVRKALGQAQALWQQEQAANLALEDEARTIRSHLEKLSAGAGLLLKRVSDLESAQQRAAALREHAQNLDKRANEIEARRTEQLDRLDTLRTTRVNTREQAARFLTERLGPKIRVTVNRFGDIDEYANALAAALRGSGLQYNVLAPELARLISPRELATAAEADDIATIIHITGIASDRAQRLASHLRQIGTESILTAPLGDTVDLSLLDGGTYKPATELSLGQRCTVVLPIILTHTERVLIVDQPEDNLDNSFVAETLVKALKNRTLDSQILFATHNPNVPVLAEADRVIHMRSDGKRGYVAHAGLLDELAIVRAITDVMEGGRDAFQTRAAFYATEYGVDSG